MKNKLNNKDESNRLERNDNEHSVLSTHNILQKAPFIKSKWLLMMMKRQSLISIKDK